MRVLLFHLVLALPGELWSALGVPSNFHDRDSTLFQPFDFPIHDLNWFLHKVELLVDLDFLQWNDKGCVGQALLKIRHMKSVMYVLQFLW